MKPGTTRTEKRYNPLQFWKPHKKVTVQEQRVHNSGTVLTVWIAPATLLDFSFEKNSNHVIAQYQAHKNLYPNAASIHFSESSTTQNQYRFRKHIKLGEDQYILTFVWDCSKSNDQSCIKQAIGIHTGIHQEVVTAQSGLFAFRTNQTPYRIKTVIREKITEILGMADGTSLHDYLTANESVGQCREFLAEMALHELEHETVVRSTVERSAKGLLPF